MPESTRTTDPTDNRPLTGSGHTLPASHWAFVGHFVGLFRGYYLGMLTLQTTAVVCAVLVPWALGAITRQVSQGLDVSRVYQILAGSLFGLAVLLVVEMLGVRGANWLHVRTMPRQRRAVTQALFAHLQQHSHRYITSEFAGALAHRIAEVSMGVSQVLAILIFDLLPLLTTLTLAVVVLSLADPLLAAFMAGWAVVFLGLCWFLARRSHPLSRDYAAARSLSTGKVVDAVTNLTNIRLFARHEYEYRYLSGFLDQEVQAAYRSLGYMDKIRWFQNAFGVALKLGMLLLALWLWRAGRIDIATFVMATSLSLMIITDVAGLSRRLLEFFEATGNIANGVRVVVRPHEVTDHPQALPLRVTRGEVSFVDVNFSYNPGRPLFEGFRLHIPAGQRVGLVGASGSGKSTLVSLLLRLYDVTAGQILIDGQDIRRVTQGSLHDQIGLIPQEPGLFHRSIRENIHYGRLDADDEALLAAIERAGARPFIEAMEQGFESLVGERGVKLSGGQRQRIAIARVLLKNAPILVLDEATSSLDSLTERYIQDKLDEIMDGKTVLVVAHRLSTVAHLDRILVLDRGRIVEDGAHAQLLAQRGYYYRLWHRQDVAA